MKNNLFVVSLQSNADLQPRETEEINELLATAFSAEIDFGFQWAGPDRHLTAYANGVLVGHVGLLEREIRVGGRRLKVGGVGTLATHPDWRRQGIAARLVRSAGEALRQSGCEFAMLFCAAGLAPFYAKHGYHRIDAPLFIHSEGRRFRIEEVKMVLPLAGEDWPEGEIDLQGLPW